ncbi:Hypothetical predicted protein [Paramuricea clavata]|uniref:Uncharacterized protein n=1 Tax=Paramuricea clavata TaxID=317549 RepID=A0A6S7IDV5_PARCT|nr:Hypothetical predicted protein [Paramuricea clavata]
MSTQRLGDEPFASDEDLFFHKLFAEDELSQRKASKTTSMFTPPFKHHVPPPPSFSQLFSQSTQNKMYSSQSKTVAKVQPHTTTHNPTASWQTFSGHSTSVTKESEVPMGFDEIDDHDLDNTCFSQHPSYHHEGML